MKVCTFFGHRDCPETVKPKLKAVLEELVVCHGVDTFYVGHQGRFDAMAHRTLQELKSRYPHIRVTVVLAYMPTDNTTDYVDTVFPEGLEITPPRYAIVRRNNWMLRQSDCVVAYITHAFGGAYRCVEQAVRQRKIVISLAAESPCNL